MKKNSSKGYPKTINEHFDKKYGEPGSKSRNEFEQKSEAFMVAELIKKKKKKAHMTQEQLAFLGTYIEAGRPALLTVDPMPLFNPLIVPSHTSPGDKD